MAVKSPPMGREASASQIGVDCAYVASLSQKPLSKNLPLHTQQCIVTQALHPGRL